MKVLTGTNKNKKQNQPLTVSHVHFVAKVPAEMGGETEPPILSVAPPVLLVSLMRQIPGAHPKLELPEVTPKLEILQQQNKITSGYEINSGCNFFTNYNH